MCKTVKTRSDVIHCLISLQRLAEVGKIALVKQLCAVDFHPMRIQQRHLLDREFSCVRKITTVAEFRLRLVLAFPLILVLTCTDFQQIFLHEGAEDLSYTSFPIKTWLKCKGQFLI